jgi:soluble lytic murein transglycosylase-like protein
MKPNCLVALALFLSSSLSLAANDTYDPVAQQQKAAKPKVYKYREGRVTAFSDIPPTRRAYVIVNLDCFACNPLSNIDWKATRLFYEEFGDVIDLAAEKHKIDSAFVRAVIHAESGFNPRARSRKGAKGLMQLMPATAREVGVTDAYAPEQNIHGGVKYLAGMLEQFRYDLTLAAAAYNAGPAAVEKYSGVPPYAETQAYVKRVNILYQRYREKDRERDRQKLSRAG